MVLMVKKSVLYSRIDWPVWLFLFCCIQFRFLKLNTWKRFGARNSQWERKEQYRLFTGRDKTSFFQHFIKSWKVWKSVPKVEKECSKLIKTFSLQILFFEVQINRVINIITALGKENAPTKYLFVLLSHLLLCTYKLILLTLIKQF